MNILGIDLGSTQTCAIIAQKDEDGLKIIGFAKTKTSGVKKGAITNIELASKSIEEAVSSAEMMSGVHYDKVVVSISGAYTKSVDSVGVVNIPNHEIGIKEIHRAVSTAKHTANLPSGYEIIHVLPYNFKINDLEHVDDPLGMSGNRLEVSTHIVISQESHIKNLKKAVELADLRVDNIVLSGYASSIACLDDSEKELGAVLIDMGGAICDMVVHMGNSIRYNDCLQIGSINITQDLSIALHAPLKEAEKVKLNYAAFSTQPNVLIQVPAMGDEKKVNEYALDAVSNVIYARTEETLMILAKILSDNRYANSTGGGVVLTGGMTKLAGLDELASATFDNKSVRLANARKDLIGGFNEIFNDPENTCAIGLCLYGAGYFTPYELDSNEKLRYKGEIENFNRQIKQEFIPQKEEEDEIRNEIFNENLQEDDTIGIQEQLDFKENKEKKPSVFSNIWHKIMNQF
ncbi:cell division protein FtsA [Campylobacter helveticus]|uniref:Cell division protein FtsA n=1 Tax=Campylobacter helveticus TaxID=28898 RepID=A0ABY3L0C6_9BACT|nr:cell division protein FtsA [Campylobacter helveticus]MCR2039483.1 cell division protein FtsA [Campylobacter helveticus]MCR2056229.1 cell division protein FtsA [Campylobacter helveticus]MCR2060602.1 cell division protein FtsA [Campylobacter helveticus]MCR2064241.1 cell division protein FtsA [Campylobacter helveticus]QBL12545.1 cell division protein FtsA [Campylobacter helveticus]